MAATIGILGTGIVGQTIAARLIELGYLVMVGTRDVGKTSRGAERTGQGVPFSEWHKRHTEVKLGTFAEAAKFGTMIIFCPNGGVALEVVKGAQAENFQGKTVLDVSNPLDFSRGMPPTLLPHLTNTNSLGEELQRALPGARVVKSLNIVNCEVMVNPSTRTGGDPTMFVAGNDATAKEEVKTLLKQFGWKDIIDLGDITGARGMEMVLPIWVRIWGVTQNGYFGFKIVR